MLECKACLRKCISNVFADLSPIRLAFQVSHRLLPIHPKRKPPSCPGRGYSTDAIPFEKAPPRGPPGLPPLPTPYVPRSNRPNLQDEAFSKTSLEQEVKWLKDPLKLAEHTSKLLRENQHQKALAIVRVASRNVECTVSWNHLVDYEMGNGRVANGVKLYNEMKKRAQQPDAYTFTTLFRGFSLNAHYPLSVSRALSIYHSMFAENSPVKPNTIHTNAVLKVCAMAGDMDGLLGVAAKLPTRGPGAPNNLTFTTILNGIRNSAWDDTKAEAVSPAKNERRSRAVMQGRRLWEEIRDRWAKGDLYIDEELVCAMGRLLLISNEEQDCDDILSLLEQTMGLARQIPRLGDPARKVASRDPEAISSSEEAIAENVELQTLLPPLDPATDTEASDLSDPTTSAFAPLSKGPPASQSPIRPGCNSLSLVIDACIRLHLVRAAQNYWGLLTSPEGTYNIIPDAENFHMYLRLLRIQRASKMAVELVEEMRRGDLGASVQLKTKTFRIAMSCCVRDKKNRHVLENAGKLVRMMIDALEHPDARALGMYLDLAMSQTPRDWRTIMGVIRGTELGVRNLRSLLAYDPRGASKQSEEDVQELVQRLIGAFDTVLDLGNEDMSREEKARCREQRHTLASYVTRKANRVQQNRKEDIERRQEEFRTHGNFEDEAEISNVRNQHYEDDLADEEVDAAARKELEQWPQGTKGELKLLGLTPRQLGQSPRQLGQSPRQLGQSPRQLGQSPRQLGQTSNWKSNLRHEKRGERRAREKIARSRREDTGLRSDGEGEW